MQASKLVDAILGICTYASSPCPSFSGPFNAWAQKRKINSNGTEKGKRRQKADHPLSHEASSANPY